MTDEEFKGYIEEIKDEPDFIKLSKFIQFSVYNTKGNLSLFETIKEYLKYNHSRTDTNEYFVPDYDYFYSFYEKFKTRQNDIKYKEQGEIDLGKTMHLKQPSRAMKNKGNFTDCYMILTDGTIFISKIPLNYKSSQSLIKDKNCKYNTIIATKMAKQLGINTSENYLARQQDGQYRTLSKFFLKPNEEFVTFYEDEENPKISTIFKKLEDSLTLRKYPREKIEGIKLEFLKQEFFAKLIGLDDQKADNTGLIVGTDDENNRSIRLTPMFDYDYSFNIAEETCIMRREADNGKTNIESLIEQYKSYPEFIEFVKTSLSSFDMRRVYQSLYKDEGLEHFNNFEEKEYLCKTMDFVNSNIRRAKETIDRLQENERGE